MRSNAGYIIIALPIWVITEWIQKEIILLADMGKYIFFLYVTHFVTSQLASCIQELLLDMVVNFTISIVVLVGLNAIIKWFIFLLLFKCYLLIMEVINIMIQIFCYSYITVELLNNKL